MKWEQDILGGESDLDDLVGGEDEGILSFIEVRVSAGTI
jgi:hypothetical protein